MKESMKIFKVVCLSLVHIGARNIYKFITIGRRIIKMVSVSMQDFVSAIKGILTHLD